MNATITTLSPVHIGNGNTYNKGIDFIQMGNRIGKVDEEKVLKLIGVENIGQWVSAIEHFDPNKTYQKQILLDLLEKRGIRDITLEKICSQISEIKSTSGKATQLKEHFRTRLKGLCIPGSSLKGAIKTAILDHFTSNDNILTKIKNDSFKDKKGNWSDSYIDNILFGKNANEKITRFLKAGDIHFSNIQSKIYEVLILNAGYDEWKFKTGQQILIETIPEGVSTTFELKIDTNLLTKNKELYKNKWPDDKTEPLSKGISYLSKIINNFTDSILEYDYESLINESLGAEGEKMLSNYDSIRKSINSLNNNEFIIRVGANSGYLFTTGMWIDKEGININDDDYSKLRKYIQKKEYDMNIWPKTRKISKDGDVFGFVKVSMSN